MAEQLVDVHVCQSNGGKVGEKISPIGGKIVYPKEGTEVFLGIRNNGEEPLTADISWDGADSKTVELSPRASWIPRDPTKIGPDGPKSVTVTFFGEPGRVARIRGKRGPQRFQTTIPFVSLTESLR